MTTALERRLSQLEAREAHTAVMPTLLITEGEDVAAAWRAQHSGQPFPGADGVFCVVLRGVKPELRDDGA